MDSVMSSRTESPYTDAIERLRDLFDEAHQRGLITPNAATLATADRNGRPSIRTISVVRIDNSGPVFFIDTHSGKGRQLEDNPCAALCFFWPELHEQVIVEGRAQLADSETTERCWKVRPREVQLAAWRTKVAAAVAPPAEVYQRFEFRRVSRPPGWYAINLYPDMLMFWKPGWRNLHGRERYSRDNAGNWQIEKLPPL